MEKIISTEIDDYFYFLKKYFHLIGPYKKYHSFGQVEIEEPTTTSSSLHAQSIIQYIINE